MDMSIFHDPTRQENYLRQCLSNDKKPIGILLGAGAPMAIKCATNGNPLIPDIAEMTKRICKELSEDESTKGNFAIICSHFESEGKLSPTIEDILSHIRSLKQVVGNGEIRGLKLTDINLLDGSICEKVNNMVNKSLPTQNTPYHKIGTWIRAISRTNPVEIFTTNYDLLMEQALEDLRIPYFDGFSGSRFTFFDTNTIEDDHLPNNWARLWKLHGSINWHSNKNDQVYRSIIPSQSDDNKVIHPSHLKYDESRKMPYLAMIDRLKTFLKNPSALLLTCGYSYRDMHLNDIIGQGLHSNSTAIVFGLLYSDISSYPEAMKLAQHSPNINLLAYSDSVIGMKHLSWLEKDIGNGIGNTISVKWIIDDRGNKLKSNFVLGNFKYLGDFFEDILGSINEGENSND